MSRRPFSSSASTRWLCWLAPFLLLTAATAQEPPTGTGLTGVYFGGTTTFSGEPSFRRLDPLLDFDWTDGSPQLFFPSDHFSVRWVGDVQPQSSESYTFITESDDGIRVRIGDQVVIDNMTDHPLTRDVGVPIHLVGGERYAITVEYYERTGDAEVRLLWSSPSTPEQVIPTERLYPNLPPTVALVSDGDRARLGSITTYIAMGSDPEGDPLTYEWFSHEGFIASGATAQVLNNRLGPSAGILVEVTDSRGLTTTASAQHTVFPRLTLSFDATSATVREDGGTPSSLIIRRDPSETWDQVQVTLEYSGTAIPGVDYQPLPGIVTLAIGQEEATLPIIPIQDAEIEEPETIIAMLTSPDVQGPVEVRLIDHQPIFPYAILREVWTGIPGARVEDLTSHPAFAGLPTFRTLEPRFEIPRNRGDDYGTRMRGFLVPAETGIYDFWIAADDAAELHLSPDHRAETRQLIASVPHATGPREWLHGSPAHAQGIPLQAGHRYYIEALHKEGAFADHLAVAWAPSGGGAPQVIDGQHLRPYPRALVWIETVGQIIHETSSDVGRLVLLRSDTTGELSVDLTYSGTATPGVDYLPLPTTVGFEDGEAAADIPVIQFQDELVEPTETVIAHLVASDEYRINPHADPRFGGSPRATVNILDDDRDLGRGVLREVWQGLSGTDIATLVNQPAFPDFPSYRTIEPRFEAPSDVDDEYGTRMRAFLVPALTGTYDFWITADDSAELYLSPDPLPEHRRLIATVPSATGPDEWRRFPSQTAGPIHLVAGQRYYIEALHKEGLILDHLAVAWGLSGSDDPLIIDGDHLRPYQAPPPAGTGTGLQATYFDDPDLQQPVISRIDALVDNDWGLGSPDPAIDPETFSVRWAGRIQAQFSETYVITAHVDDGVRLWIDNELLIDEWTVGPATSWHTAIVLDAGQTYDIVFEYFDNFGFAKARLLWSSPSTPQTAVPTSQLYPLPTGIARGERPASAAPAFASLAMPAMAVPSTAPERASP